MKKLLVLIVSIFLLTSCFGKEEAVVVEENVEIPAVVVEDVKDELSDEDTKTEDVVGTGAEDIQVEDDEEVKDNIETEEVEDVEEDITTENEDEVMAEFEKEINELFEMVENEK